MYLWPSASSRCAPAARLMNNGDAPTDLNARTGLSTPPGRIREAAANSSSDLAYRLRRRTGTLFQKAAGDAGGGKREAGSGKRNSHWQPQHSSATARLGAVFERERAPVGFGDLTAQREADAGTGGLGREERHEQIGRVR